MWFQVLTLIGLAFAIGYLVDTKKAVNRLQAQVEHLHSVMLKEFERR